MMSDTLVTLAATGITLGAVYLVSQKYGVGWALATFVLVPLTLGTGIAIFG